MRDKFRTERVKQFASSTDRRGFLRKAGIGATVLVGGTGAGAGTAAAEGEMEDHYFTMQSAEANENDEYEVSVNFDWDINSYDDLTDPREGVGIYWDDDRWEVLYADYDHDKHCAFDTYHADDGGVEGVSWFYDQEEDYYDDDECSFRQCTTKIQPKPGYDTYPVYGEYFHTWNDTDINGLGLSVDGFSVSWETEGESWKKAQEYAGFHD